MLVTPQRQFVYFVGDPTSAILDFSAQQLVEVVANRIEGDHHDFSLRFPALKTRGHEVVELYVSDRVTRHDLMVLDYSELRIAATIAAVPHFDGPRLARVRLALGWLSQRQREAVHDAFASDESLDGFHRLQAEMSPTYFDAIERLQQWDIVLSDMEAYFAPPSRR